MKKRRKNEKKIHSNYHNAQALLIPFITTVHPLHAPILHSISLTWKLIPEMVKFSQLPGSEHSNRSNNIGRDIYELMTMFALYPL